MLDSQYTELLIFPDIISPRGQGSQQSWLIQFLSIFLIMDSRYGLAHTPHTHTHTHSNLLITHLTLYYTHTHPLVNLTLINHTACSLWYASTWTHGQVSLSTTSSNDGWLHVLCCPSSRPVWNPPLPPRYLRPHVVLKIPSSQYNARVCVAVVILNQ